MKILMLLLSITDITLLYLFIRTSIRNYYLDKENFELKYPQLSDKDGVIAAYLLEKQDD